MIVVPPIPELFWDVWCPNPGCEHGGKKWRVLGPGAEAYQCAKCAAKMIIDAVDPEPAEPAA